jgi:hypothetical protein
MNFIKPFQLYLRTFLFSFVFNWLMLIFICNALSFDGRSAICVYLYGVGGFFLKGIIFFTPLLLLFNEDCLKSKTSRVLIFLLPFISFLLWFLTIIVFQIEAFYPDLSFGYIARFPHFYVQLLSSLLIPLIMLWFTNRKIKAVLGDQ